MRGIKLPKDLMKVLFPEMEKLKAEGKCPFCGKKINKDDFRDELSKKEFGISGLCQECQDDFFD